MISEVAWEQFVRSGFAIIRATDQDRSFAAECADLALKALPCIEPRDPGEQAGTILTSQIDAAEPTLLRRLVGSRFRLVAKCLFSGHVRLTAEKPNLLFIDTPGHAVPGHLHIDRREIGDRRVYVPAAANIGMLLDGLRPPHAGGIVVVPGSHLAIRKLLMDDLAAGRRTTDTLFNRLWPEIATASLVEEIRLDPGDVLLTHGLLIHGTARNDHAEKRRLAIYWRIALDGGNFDSEEMKSNEIERDDHLRFLQHPFAPFRIPSVVADRLYSSDQLYQLGAPIAEIRAKLGYGAS